MLRGAAAVNNPWCDRLILECASPVIQSLKKISRNSLPRFYFHSMKALRSGLNKGIDLVPFLVSQKVEARLDTPVGLGFKKFGHYPVLK